MQENLTLPCNTIVQGRNPRTYFDPESMAELETSIKSQGVIQPLLVRPLSSGKYEIVAGERRWRAANTVFGVDYQIPVLIRELTDQEADEAALTENIQRDDMSPTEEAVAAAKILGKCQGNREEAANRLGWTVPVLESRLALMNCSESVRKALNERKIKLGVAELLAAIKKENQDVVLTRLLAAPAMPTIPELKAMLNQLARSLESAIFNKEGCAHCVHNSSTQHVLFSESIDAGNCTNGECFDQKTEESLQSKAEALKENYPVIRIVRPGENFTLIKLKADGFGGVGEDQAKACRGCQKFGAAISAVPGKVGNTYTDVCFDAECQSVKVAAQIQAVKTAEETAKKALVKEQKKDALATTGSAPEAKAAVKVEVQDSNRIKDYRLLVWRRLLNELLMLNHETNLVALLALCLTGNGGKIESTKMREVFKKLTGSYVDNFNIFKTATAVKSAPDEVVKTLHLGLAASAVASIEERTVTQLLTWLKADLADHWMLNAEYLVLLTKSEMEVVADEIGLKAHIGEEFSKLMLSKKDEIIKALLKVEGFDYARKVPKQLLWPVS